MTKTEILLFAEERGLLKHTVRIRHDNDDDPHFNIAVDANDQAVVYAGLAGRRVYVGVDYLNLPSRCRGRRTP